MLATLSESTEPSRWHTTSRHRQTHKQLAHVQHWYLHQWAAAVHNTKPMYCFNCSNRCLNSTWTPGRWNFTSVWLENILRTFFFPLTVIICLLNKQKRRRICVCVLDICSYSSKTPGKWQRKKCWMLALTVTWLWTLAALTWNSVLRSVCRTLYNQSAGETGKTHSVEEFLLANKTNHNTEIPTPHLYVVLVLTIATVKFRGRKSKT